ncbi:MAG: aminotransferase class I/II-fold pyridoxal phosphate-dependent enzyme [Acidobacteria bacterium]|nr:aminotransferase class I/II-fold pyridoxal phosphate-dependent enzyme [Acidobacteriota bacterium]
MLTEPLAPYMLWAKTREAAEIDLAGSNLLSCTLADLPGAADALQLTAPNDNGYAPLVESIAAHCGVAADRVVTATGCSGANFLAIAALVGAGDEVLVEQPGYDPLVGACTLLGARVRRIARPFSQRFQFDLDAVRAAVTPATRLIIVTSPHNPSGVSLDAAVLRALARIAEDARAHLLVDEVYRDAANLGAGDAAPTASATTLDGPVIVTNSLTKSYGLNGLRCGWAVAPAAVAARMRRVRDLVDAVGSAPSDRLSALAFQHLPLLAARTTRLVTANLALARTFAAAQPGLLLAEPPRATVIFPQVSGLSDTSALVADIAARHGVAVAPGHFFDAPAHMRISLAGQTGKLAEGLRRLGRALRPILIGVWLLATGVTPFAQAAATTAAPPAVDRRQLLADLRTLSADDMEGRLVGSPGGARARAYVIERFKASGLLPFGGSYESPFTFTAGRGAAAAERQGVNIIGHLTGTREPQRYIVITAHYDHIGARNGVTFNGADDNASGTAALFALAAYFKAHPPAHSLIFAALDAEESGLRGARQFVARPPVDAASLVINLNMDMIGRDANNLLYVVGTHAQSALKPVIARVAAAAAVTLTMGHDDPAKKDIEDWSTSSDHAPFCQAKIPCLYFGVEDFENHHKATDKYETMTHDFYVRVVETMIRVTQAFDAAPPSR